MDFRDLGQNYIALNRCFLFHGFTSIVSLFSLIVSIFWECLICLRAVGHLNKTQFCLWLQNTNKLTDLSVVQCIVFHYSESVFCKQTFIAWACAKRITVIASKFLRSVSRIGRKSPSTHQPLLSSSLVCLIVHTYSFLFLPYVWTSLVRAVWLTVSSRATSNVTQDRCISWRRTNRVSNTSRVLP